MTLPKEVAAAVEAVKSGEAVTTDDFVESDQVIVAEEVDPQDTNSTVNSLLGSQESDSPSPKDDEDQETSTEGSSVSSSDTVTVTDDKGRRKVKVDFENKDQIKKYVRMAHGARKWQAERDQAQAKLKAYEGIDADNARQVLEHWNDIENAYAADGVAGIINLIEGRDDAFSEWEETRKVRWEERRAATPEELEVFQERDRLERMERELIRERQLRAKDKEQQEASRMAAEEAKLQSEVNPVFDKYRFAGKLGDADAEADLDAMLWESALSELETYEEQNIPITRDLIEREFKNKSTRLRKHIKVQAEKRTKNVIAQKKQEATENAQATVMRGIKGNQTSQEAVDLLNTPGGLKSLLKGWNKYGSVFNK